MRGLSCAKEEESISTAIASVVWRGNANGPVPRHDQGGGEALMKEYSKTLLILAQTLVEKTGTLYHNGKTKKMQSSIGSRIIHWLWWHQFLTQFFMLFHMVPLVLLSMVAFSTMFLLVEILPTANQILWNELFLKLPWKAKPKVPCKRSWETGVKSDPAFCLGPSIEKTNSVLGTGTTLSYDYKSLARPGRIG